MTNPYRVARLRMYGSEYYTFIEQLPDQSSPWNPMGWSEAEIPSAASIEDLRDKLLLMIRAFDQPTLIEQPNGEMMEEP